MGRFISPGWVVALGLLASLQAEARANCFHGFARCNVCSGGYGYYVMPNTGVSPTPMPTPTTGPVIGSMGGTRMMPPPTDANDAGVSGPPAPPALAPADLAPGAQANGFAAPDAGMRYFPQTSSYAAPSYPYSFGAFAAPAFAPNTAAAPSFAFRTPGSFLFGFDRNARMTAIPAGTRMTTPQELGSFLFQTLSRFRQNRSKQDLIRMGIEVFTDVLKFTPIGADLSVIEDIAEMVLGVRTGGGGAMVGPGPGGVGAVAAANTVTATVPPGGGPYKVTITIEPMSGPATSTTHVIGETSPPPPVPGDHSGPPTPPQDGPAANPAGTSEPPAATPTPPSSALPRTATPAE